ncbi:MAG: Response regulator receiver protein [Myxococcales bacterium]|nr:Response regulator receiver protein [Myxococcales bacterium]
MTPACGGVLVVEDDVDILRAIVQVLEDEGFPVRTAENGQAALETLRASHELPPCVILLDLMMPVMDGWSFRATQLRDPFLSHIPVILLTAGGGAAEKAEIAQANGALRKPVDLELLLETLGPFLR